MRLLSVSALALCCGFDLTTAKLRDAHEERRVAWANKRSSFGQLPRGDFLKDFNPSPTPTASPMRAPTPFPSASPSASPTKSPTPEPTPNPTPAPTTPSPTTQAPTSRAPITPLPTTPSPTTQAPSTQSPTTQAPTSQAPTTQSPTTRAPITPSPTTSAPSTPSPTTPLPTTPEPTQRPTPQPTPGENGCEAADLTGRVVFEISDDGLTDVDGSGAGITSGDIFVFDNDVTVPGTNLTGSVFGRCVVLESLFTDGNTYCGMDFDLPDGRIFMQGLFYDLTIVAGSGCYLGLGASVLGIANQTGLFYTFEIADGSTLPAGCPDDFSEAWEEESGDTLIDWDQDGEFSIGDYVVFDANVLRAGTVTGTTAGDCVVLPSLSDNPTGDNNTYCQITFDFEEGSLTTQGIFGEMVIVGGTGCFRGAQGILAGETLVSSNFRYTPAITQTPPFLCTENIFEMTWRESGGSELLGDYDGDDNPSPGELFVFDSTTLTVGNNIVTGTTSGRCQFLPEWDGEDEDVYCLITFSLDEGMLAIQGMYTDMEIVGGSGCFIGARGRLSVEDVTGEDDITFFEYSFDIY